AFWSEIFKNKKTAKSKTPPLTFKQTVSALANLPKFFKLVCQTSPSMTVANAVLRVIKSAIPVAVLYVGKLIIDQVIHISQGKQTLSDNYLWELVAIEFFLAIFSDGL